MRIILATGLVFAAASYLSVTSNNLERENLVAWCIVPFDANQRGPAERAAMLKEIGMRRCAYDWRKEHVPLFEDELREYQKHGIEMFAFWGTHDKAFELFKKYEVHPQIWQMMPLPQAKAQAARIGEAANAMLPLAKRTAGIGCKLALYNHGGWSGEPSNLVAVCKRLRSLGHAHVGIVYNWHHGHGHIDDWIQSLAEMRPYLHCLNINGMSSDAEPKIQALGQGHHDAKMLKAVIDSGYNGPIGILDHQSHLDTRTALLDNLDGLSWLRKEIQTPGSGGAKPTPRANRARPRSAAAPKESAFGREPLDPTAHPAWQEFVNRDRVYDFYAKQALQYGSLPAAQVPELLPHFLGLDGGKQGHWGNQNDKVTWKDGRVRDMLHGSMVSGVFRGAGKTIARAVTVDLPGDHHAVFDQDSLRFETAWKGEAVAWSDVRRGLMCGIPKGNGPEVEIKRAVAPADDARYLGLYRQGPRVIFAYDEDGTIRYREAIVDGDKIRERLVAEPTPAPAQWPQRLQTKGSLGDQQPYAFDNLSLPFDNPWKSMLFVSGIDLASATRVAICTMHGEVWVCDFDGDDLSNLSWKRFAAGLHQPLGLKVDAGVIHVMCRDQVVALHDSNHDDEADFYACIANSHQTSAGAHDFITGLQRDRQGRWYFASGNQGLCRVSADGRTLNVLATGFRNPNGLGISPDGKIVMTSVQEGNWTPASAVCEVGKGGHFGAGGPKDGPRGKVPPLVYLPRGVDNSSAAQVYINGDRWGPARGNWVHFSSGCATHFLLLREVIKGQAQAAVVPLWGEFLAACHRGRFSPYDGQLYVAGAQGWGNYGVMDGSLQRVRYTGGKYPYPIGFETRENGILLTFADPKGIDIAEASKWFAQHWNYKYGPAYGSDEYSLGGSGAKGHDRVLIRSVQRLDGGKRVFIEIPQLRPVDQLHLHFAGSPRVEVFATLHQLGEPFTDFPGYQRIAKQVAAVTKTVDERDPKALFAACSACHHSTAEVVGPPLTEIRKRYANDPEGIVKWAMAPELRNPKLPPMPSFKHLGEDRLKLIAEYILSGQ